MSARHRLVRIAAMLLLGASASASAVRAADYTVLIRGGTVVDGTGAPRRAADVAIKDDRIVAVGPIPAGATADTVIDATGKLVVPGFIDPHSHSWPGLGNRELADAKPILLQGITTVMINPDGFGPADLKPQVEAIEALHPALNALPMIGHNGVRTAVMGLANRQPTPAELAKMQGLVKAAMDYGAYGLSSGPFYIPGKYSKTPELVAMAQVAARYPHSFYISHVRDESSYDIGVINAIKELITISRDTKIIGVVTHMKMLGPEVWGKSAEAVKLIDAARAEGLSIWADQYPYAASGSNLQASLIPGWAQEGGPEAIARRLQNPEQRALIRKEMVGNLARRGGANAIQIARFPADPSIQGKRLDEIARARLKDPIDVAMDLLVQDTTTRGDFPFGQESIISFNMNEKDLETIMKQPWTMTSTDGGLSTFGAGVEHPRSYGAFPRKLRRYVLDKPVISMEQAIHSMTGLPAQVFTIPDRGVLKAGNYADVVVFDPKTIRDVATYIHPDAYSVGIEEVLVNGKLAIDGGAVTGARGGKVLLRTRT